jgi:hypothetical protein
MAIGGRQAGAGDRSGCHNEQAGEDWPATAVVTASLECGNIAACPPYGAPQGCLAVIPCVEVWFHVERQAPVPLG